MTTRRAAHNTRLASCGVTCLHSSSVFQFGFCGGLTVLCSENPHERQAWERYAKAYETTRKNKYFFDELLFRNYVVFLYLHFIKFAFNKNALFLSWIKTKAFINTFCWTFKP